MPKNTKPIANFLFEVGMLARTPRSGFYFLGSGKQSVAEHVHRVVYIGYVLSILEKDVNMEKILKMCLFHDLAEARTSDLNYVHKKYAKSGEEKALKDLASMIDFGDEIKEIVEEFNEKKTKEAILVCDADQLEFLLSLKEEIDTGNKRAETWVPPLIKRLKTASARELAEQITNTDSDGWWFGDKDDKWWVNREKL